MLNQNSMSHFRRTLEVLKRVLGMDRYVKWYLLYRRTISGYYILTNGVRRAFLRNWLRSGYQFNQKPLIWTTFIPSLPNETAFIDFLKARKVRFFEGGWSIYIPPQPGLEQIFGKVTEFYPADSGYKIVKDLNPPETAKYLSIEKNPVVSWPESMLSGNLFSQFNAACVAEQLSLSPKIYDLIELRANTSRMSCFVVQHVASPKLVTLSDFELFIARLDKHVRNGMIQTAIPYLNRQHMDFSPPDCNHNLIKSADGKLYYVDFQQFAVPDHKASIIKLLEETSGILSFGDVHPLRLRKPYLYQTIPGIGITGRRDSEIRWHAIREMLGSVKIEVAQRVVMDICCNSGMMLAQALIDGALWTLGWDLPEVVEVARKIQRTLGFSRISLLPAHLSESYSLIKDIDERIKKNLSGSIVFYLAAWNHIGFVTELKAIPWKALVFEGHEYRTDYSEVVTLMRDKCQARLVEQRTLVDGDSLPRQLLLFAR